MKDTEIYKVEHVLAPAFMSDIFSRNHNLNANNVSSNTRSKAMFYCTYTPHTVRFGRETLRHLGPKIWALIPTDIKSSVSVECFKKNIKQWINIDCPCRLCTDFIPGVGYL